MEPLVQYYDRLASRYDADRFGNSYGRYVDAQERRVLCRWLAPFQGGPILDLACGTGRLLDLATHGLDASPAMVRIAQEKHPQKQVRCARATEVGEFRTFHEPPLSRPSATLSPRREERAGRGARPGRFVAGEHGGSAEGTTFDAIFCLHLLMHLPPAEIADVLRACFEQLRPGGVMIFDIPSALRRRLTAFRPVGWHAGTALSLREIAAMAGPRWRIKATRGILFFPIHRLPPKVRPLFRPLDDLVGATPLQPLCSYRFCCLQRPQ